MPSKQGTFTVRRPAYVGCECELDNAAWVKLFKNPTATTATGLPGIYRYVGKVTTRPGQKPKFELYANKGLAMTAVEALKVIDNTTAQDTVAFVNWDEQGMPPEPEDVPGKTSLIYVAAAVMGEAVFTPFTRNDAAQCINLSSGYYHNLPQ